MFPVKANKKKRKYKRKKMRSNFILYKKWKKEGRKNEAKSNLGKNIRIC